MNGTSQKRYVQDAELMMHFTIIRFVQNVSKRYLLKIRDTHISGLDTKQIRIKQKRYSITKEKKLVCVLYVERKLLNTDNCAMNAMQNA